MAFATPNGKATTFVPGHSLCRLTTMECSYKSQLKSHLAFDRKQSFLSSHETFWVKLGV